MGLRSERTLDGCCRGCKGITRSLGIFGRDERDENNEQTHDEVQPDIAVVKDQQADNTDGDA